MKQFLDRHFDSLFLGICVVVLAFIVANALMNAPVDPADQTDVYVSACCPSCDSTSPDARTLQEVVGPVSYPAPGDIKPPYVVESPTSKTPDEPKDTPTSLPIVPVEGTPSPIPTCDDIACDCEANGDCATEEPTEPPATPEPTDPPTTPEPTGRTCTDVNSQGHTQCSGEHSNPNSGHQQNTTKTPKP